MNSVCLPFVVCGAGSERKWSIGAELNCGSRILLCLSHESGLANKDEAKRGKNRKRILCFLLVCQMKMIVLVSVSRFELNLLLNASNKGFRILLASNGSFSMVFVSGHSNKNHLGNKSKAA